jgi:uncharacterized protein
MGHDLDEEASAVGPSSMSAAAGIGLKPEHYTGLLTKQPGLGFLEVHAENYMGAGGPPHRYLEALAELYSLSFHGVGLSLGGAEPLDKAHLAKWRRLVGDYAPGLVSEHVAWSRRGETALNDLLPIPYTSESLRIFCEHVDQMQQAIGRRILIENPSRYADFEMSEMSEGEFLSEAVHRTGCGLLLDVNNVYVSARNLGEDADAYLSTIPTDAVGEIHLAGHSVKSFADGTQIRIDDHGSRVDAPVWELYRQAVRRIGRRPTLVEWDTDVPPLEVLVAEARQADRVAAAAMTTQRWTPEGHALAR